jgi:hypothetical protein
VAVNDGCAAKQVGGVVIKSDLWPDQHRKRVLPTAVSQRVVAGRRAARRAGRRAAGGRPAGGRRAASGLGRRPTAYGLPKSVCVPVGVHDVVNNSELELIVRCRSYYVFCRVTD